MDNVSWRLKSELPGHDVERVPDDVRTNDHAVMAYAVAGKYDALFTIDKNVRFQQAPETPLRIVVLGMHKNEQGLETQRDLIARARETLPHLVPGEYCHIDTPRYAAYRQEKTKQVEVDLLRGVPERVLPQDRQGPVYQRGPEFIYDYQDPKTKFLTECPIQVFERAGKQSVAVLSGLPENADLGQARAEAVPDVFHALKHPQMGLLYIESVNGKSDCNSISYGLSPHEQDMLVARISQKMSRGEIEELLKPHTIELAQEYDRNQQPQHGLSFER